MKRLILGFLAMVMAMLITGCATGKNTGGDKGRERITLPEQKTDKMPFLVRKADYSERFTEEELATTAVVIGYLEAIATSSHIPIRVREGFLFKDRGHWYLVNEWSPEKELACTVFQSYYVTYMKATK